VVSKAGKGARGRGGCERTLVCLPRLGVEVLRFGEVSEGDLLGLLAVPLGERVS
jgi:hypothetical protein